jgi:hypothetical protein
MPNTLTIYATPAETIVELTLDSGAILSAPTTSANGRDDAHVLALPAGTSGQGSVLTVTCVGRLSQRVRGIVHPSDAGGAALFQFDDFGELAVATTTPTPPTPEPTPPPSGEDPEAIIQAVYEMGDYDLSTHDGCGQFTEACCTALHTQHSDLWGHIAKYGAQNQYNGHAVDALMLLAGEGCGIYDIIHDSVSPNASPAYNYKGAPDYELWYYDPPATRSVRLTAQFRQPPVAHK